MVSGIWVKGEWNRKFSTGIDMVPRGEVGLIFAEVAKRSGIFNNTTLPRKIILPARRFRLFDHDG